MALWTVHGDGRQLADQDVVRPNERLSWPLTVGLGIQHMVAMFGAAVLVPALTGLPVTTTLLFSGVGTLLFLLLTRNRIPGYLGSSYAFVAPLVAARADGLAAQLGGVLFAGLLLAVVGVAVKALGIRLLDSVMPPIVTGGVIVLIALNLAPNATHDVQRQPVFALVTLAAIGLVAVLSHGLLARLSVLAGVLVGWLAATVSGGLDPVALDSVRQAAWFGLPALRRPELHPSVMLLVLPAVLVLVAQNVGHVKAIAAVTGRDLDGSIGDALIADGLATTLAGAGGGAGLSTTAENIGVMTATRVCSTAAYVVAALGAVALSFSPKIGAAVGTLPIGVIGGASLVLYGLVALIGVRIWIEHRVDLTNPVNLMVAGASIVAGVGDLTIGLGPLELGGIAWGSLLIVLGYPLLRTVSALRR